MKKLIIICSIIIPYGFASCHQIYKVQWRCINSDQVSKTKLINEIKRECLNNGLVEATNRSQFPHTLILMRQFPVEQHSIDVGLRYIDQTYFIDIFGGYGAENGNFGICKANIESSIIKGNFGKFEKIDRVIIP